MISQTQRKIRILSHPPSDLNEFDYAPITHSSLLMELLCKTRTKINIVLYVTFFYCFSQYAAKVCSCLLYYGMFVSLFTFLTLNRIEIIQQSKEFWRERYEWLSEQSLAQQYFHLFLTITIIILPFFIVYAISLEPDTIEFLLNCQWCLNNNSTSKIV
jgi:hypothetical protein